MTVIDRALARRAADGKVPIRVGMIGAGFRARGVLHPIAIAFRGRIAVAAIANRTPDRAMAAFRADGMEPVRVDSPLALSRARATRPVVFVLGPGGDGDGDGDGDGVQKHCLASCKLGQGPHSRFATCCQLCHYGVPFTIARAVLMGDAAIAPVTPRVEVLATAKRDLQAGDVIDGLGGFDCDGLCETAEATRGFCPLPWRSGRVCGGRSHATAC